MLRRMSTRAGRRLRACTILAPLHRRSNIMARMRTSASSRHLENIRRNSGESARNTTKRRHCRSNRCHAARQYRLRLRKYASARSWLLRARAYPSAIPLIAVGPNTITSTVGLRHRKKANAKRIDAELKTQYCQR